MSTTNTPLSPNYTLPSSKTKHLIFKKNYFSKELLPLDSSSSTRKVLIKCLLPINNRDSSTYTTSYIKSLEENSTSNLL